MCLLIYIYVYIYIYIYIVVGPRRERNTLKMSWLTKRFLFFYDLFCSYIRIHRFPAYRFRQAKCMARGLFNRVLNETSNTSEFKSH